MCHRGPERNPIFVSRRSDRSRAHTFEVTLSPYSTVPYYTGERLLRRGGKKDQESQIKKVKREGGGVGAGAADRGGGREESSERGAADRASFLVRTHQTEEEETL